MSGVYKSRTTNVFRNTVAGIAGQFVTYLMTFICRTVFVYTLGREYLGLQGLFSNILTLLSLAELGIGSAISFSLYKPLSENDEEKVKSLMFLFKRAYRIIAACVAALGLALLPFLDFFIEKRPNIPESFELIYLLYVANSAMSYLFIYKQSLIQADQRGYIVTLYLNFAVIARDVFQIIWLLTVGSYIPVLVIQIVFTFIANFVISKKANRLYPYITDKKAQKLAGEERRDIVGKIRVMFIYRIGAYIVTGTDTILISKFLGLAVLGVYSNYSLLTSTVRTFINFFTNALTPSVGNAVSTKDPEKVADIFNMLNFLYFWVYSLCAVGFYALINSFVRLWLGESYVLSAAFAVAAVLKFYFTGLRQPVMVFRNALGLYLNAKLLPVAESVVNVVASLLLLKYFGIIGVVAGTVVSIVTTAWVEPFVLFKRYFKSGGGKYALRMILYSSVTAVSVGIMTLVGRVLSPETIFGFLLTGAIAFVVHNGLIILIFHSTDEFKDCVGRVKNILLKLKQKVEAKRC